MRAGSNASASLCSAGVAWSIQKASVLALKKGSLPSHGKACTMPPPVSSSTGSWEIRMRPPHASPSTCAVTWSAR